MNLRELAALRDRATAGPWKVDPGDRDWVADLLDVPYDEAPDPYWLSGLDFIDLEEHGNLFREPDAAYIAAVGSIAPESWSALADVVDAARRAEDMMSAEHDRCEPDGRCFDTGHAMIRDLLRAALDRLERP